MTQTLIIDPMFNTPGMHDDTGAFEPHALTLHKTIPQACRLSFDNLLPRSVRFAELIRDMGDRDEENLVHVGHGWHIGCECGLNTEDLTRFRLFFTKMPKLKKVLFFSCSTASDPLQTSLAWRVMKEDFEVLAHTNEGRDVQNPNVIHLARGGSRKLPDWRGNKSPNWKAWVHFLLHEEGWRVMAQAFCGYDTTAPRFRFYFDADGYLQWEPREQPDTVQP